MKTSAKLSILLVAFVAMAMPASIKAQTLQDAINFTQSEQFDNASKAFQSLISQQPQNGTNYYYYGNFYIQEFRADSTSTSLKKACTNAAAQFEKGKNVDPGNPLNYIGLGTIALFNKDLTKANEYFDQAKNLLPSKKNKVKLDKIPQAQAYVRLADAYVQTRTNDTTAIFSSLREAQKLDPKNFESYIVAGDAYMYLLNAGSEAIRNYNLSSRLNPKSPAAQLRIGQLWKRTKNYESALDAYKAVIQIDQNYAPAYKELGFLNAQLGKAAEAKQNFAHFLELSSGNTDAQLQYINTLFQLKDYSEVINQANKLLPTHQSNADLYRALGYASLEAGKTDDAVAALDNFFKKVPEDKIRSSDYYYYARALSNQKKDSIAGNYYLKAYAEDTLHYDYLDLAANSYRSGGNYLSAINTYQRKIKTGYYKLTDIYYVGLSYQALKQYENAITQFSTIIEKSPDYIQAYLLKARCYSKLDPESTAGTAQPAYQLLLDKIDAQQDPTKYNQEKSEALSYMNFYYYKQSLTSKTKIEDMKKAIEYGKKALEIDPNNKNAKTINEALEKQLNRPAPAK